MLEKRNKSSILRIVSSFICSHYTLFWGINLSKTSQLWIQHNTKIWSSYALATFSALPLTQATRHPFTAHICIICNVKRTERRKANWHCKHFYFHCNLSVNFKPNPRGFARSYCPVRRVFAQLSLPWGRGLE